MGAVDVVYPLGSGSRWDDNELRFSLRSIDKNFLDLGRVFVVGECPAWLDANEVVHIQAQDRRRWPKDANIIDKVLLACGQTTPRFLRMSDDQVVLQPVASEEMPPYGTRQDALGERPKKGWPVRMWHTRKWLIENGYASHNFDLHLPMIVDAKKFAQAAARIPYKSSPGMCVNTSYGNIAGLEPADIGGRQARWLKESATRCHRTIMRKLFGEPAKAFCNYNGKSLTDPLKYVWCILFPNQSRFEITDHNLTFNPNEWRGGRGPKKRPKRKASRTGPVRHQLLQSMTKAQRRKLRQRRRR
jgi:hypothetical protein